MFLASCVQDSTGPAEGRFGRVAIAPRFEGRALAMVDFVKVRILIMGVGGVAAVDTVVDFPADADSITLNLTFVVDSASQHFTLELAMIGAAGDTVYRAGPDSIVVSPGAIVRPPEEPTVRYTGTGANAARVRITAVPAELFFGDSGTLAAEALDSAGNVIPGTPITWHSLDTLRARIPDYRVGTVYAQPQRGPVRIAARLLTPVSAETVITIQPRPNAVTMDHGGGQTGSVGDSLAGGLVAKVTAADGLGVQGIPVIFAVTAGGGTLGWDSATADTVRTDKDGFAGVWLRLGRAAGAQSVTARVAGLATTAVFNVTAAPKPARRLEFTVQPTGTVAGAAFVPALQATARDTFGNVATAFASTVTLSLVADPGGALLGVLSTTAVNGVATFSGARPMRADTGQHLVAAATGLVPDTSVSFAVVPSAPYRTHFIVGVAAPQTAGVAIAPPLQVSIVDQQGNLIPTATDSITLVLGLGSSATILGTPRRAAVGGVAVFDDIAIDRAGPAFRFSAQVAGLIADTTNTFAVAAGVAKRLEVTTQPPATMVAGTPFALAVTARDSFGNVAVGFTGNVTVAPSAGTLSGTPTVAAVAGVATFAGLTADSAGSGFTLTATATGLAGATSSAYAVTPAAATRLAFAVQPPAVDTAGSPFAATVQAFDAFGNLATDFADTVTLVLDSATNGAGDTLQAGFTAAAAGGVATFTTPFLRRATGGVRLVAVAGGVAPDTSTPIQVMPAAAAALELAVQPPATVAALAPFGMVVRARDAFGNLATGFAGPVSVALGANLGGATLGGRTDTTAAAGLATFTSLTLDRAGSGYTLVASSGALTPATSDSVAVTASSAARLAFAGQPPASAVAGEPFAVRVQALDAAGNPAFGYSGAIALSLVANAAGDTLQGTVTLPATLGAADFTGLSLRRVQGGVALLAASGTLAADTSTAIAVAPAAAAGIAFTTQPPVVDTAGHAFGVVVTARDPFGNLATGLTDSVRLTLIDTDTTGDTLTGALAVMPAGGTATATSLALRRVGSYALVATAGSLADTSAAFAVVPTAAAQLEFAVQPPGTVTASAPFVVVAQARDTFGNVAVGYAGDVTVALGANPGGATLRGTLTALAAGGRAPFADLTLDRAGTGYTLVASAAGVTAATSGAFDVAASAATQLAFVVAPATPTVAGTRFPVVVQARDSAGNPALDFAGAITLSLVNDTAGDTLQNTQYASAANGAAAFDSLFLRRAQSGVAVRATSGTLAPATSGPLTVTPTAAAALRFTTPPPATDTAGSPFAAAVTAFDRFGNRASGFVAPVTVSIRSGPAGATLGGTTVMPPDTAAVAAFAGLMLDRAGAYVLQASSDTLALDSAAITIASGAPATAVIEAGAGQTATVGTALAESVAVRVSDAFGNRLPGVTVLFTPDSSGSFAPPSAVTDSGGRAAAQWTLGHAPGTRTASVTADGLAFVPVTATALPAAPDTLIIVQGDGQSGVVGDSLAVRPRVQVHDAYGNPLQGVSVAFAADSGSGTISPPSAVTDAAGLAEAVWTLDTVAGVKGARAFVAGGSDTARFVALAVPGPTARLQVGTAPPDSVAAGVQFGVAFLAFDGYGNAAVYDSSLVTLAVDTGPGTLSGLLTRPLSGAAANFAPLSLDKTGRYWLRATRGALSVLTGPIEVLAGLPVAVTIASGNAQSGTAGVALAQPVAVSVADALGNPVAGVPVTFAPVHGTTTPPSGVTDAAGRATTSWILGTLAGPQTLWVKTAFDSVAIAATANPGLPNKTAFVTQPPATVTAGVPFQVVVAVTDVWGNRTPSFADSVRLRWSFASDTALGTTTALADTGVAIFTGVVLRRASSGGQLIAFVDSTIGETPSVAVQVLPAAAAQLVITTQPPGSVVAGTAFGTAVTAFDAYGNRDTVYGADVALAIDSGPAGATLGGTASLPATNGLASFAGLTLDKAGAYRLRAASGVLTGATTAPILVAAGTASALVVDSGGAQTDTITATLQPLVVQARDGLGNPVAGVPVTFYTPWDSLTDTTDATGRARAAGFTIGTEALAYQNWAFARSIPDSVPFAVTTLPGNPAGVVLYAPGGPDTAGVPIGPAVVAFVGDRYGNRTPAWTGTITVRATDTTVSLGPDTVVTVAAGDTSTASFGNLVITQRGFYQLVAEAAGLPVTDTSSGVYTVWPVGPQVLAFQVQPANALAGAVLSPTIEVAVRDTFGNGVWDSIRTIGVALTPACGATCVLQGTTSQATGGDGVARFTDLAVPTAASGYRLIASWNGLTVTSDSFAVSPNLSRMLQVVSGTGQSDTVMDTLALPLRVRLTDSLGNAIAGEPVQFHGLEPPLTTDTVLTDSGGYAELVWQLGPSADTQTVTVWAAGQSTAFWMVGLPDSAMSLAFLTQPVATMAGSPIPTVRVHVIDAYGNTVTTDSTWVHIQPTITEPPTYAQLFGPLSVQAVAGVVTYDSLYMTQAGAYTLTANVMDTSGLTSAVSASFSILPASAAYFDVMAQYPARAGSEDTVTVTAMDTHGNRAIGYTGTLVFSTTDSAATVPPNRTLTSLDSGRVAVPFVFRTAGIFTVTVTDGSMTGTTNATVGPGPASGFQLAMGTPVAGVPDSVTVRVVDAFGNLYQAGPWLISLLDADTTTILPAPYLLMYPDTGVHVFPVTFRTAGPHWLIADDTTTLRDSLLVNVQPGAAATIAFLQQPPADSGVAGVPFSPAVRVGIVDTLGNVVTSASDSVFMRYFIDRQALCQGDCTPPPVLGTSRLAAVNGVATFSDIAVPTAGQPLRLTAQWDTTFVSSNQFTVVAGPAMNVVVAGGDSQLGTAGTPLTDSLVVEVRDAYGNGVTGWAVTWATPDGGSFDSTTSHTNGRGQAYTHWSLGPATGVQTAIAKINADSGVTFTATAMIAAPTTTWLGLTPDWNDPNNWSTTLVPSGTDVAFVPLGTLNAPRLMATAPAIGGLAMQNGTSLTVDTMVELDVHGSVDGSYATVSGGGLVRLTGPSGTVRGSFRNLKINGTYTLNDSLVVAGNLDVWGEGGPAFLVLDGHRARVAGGFSTYGEGALTMTNPADSLLVGASVSFSGPAASSSLTAGLIQVGGSIYAGPASVFATGAHRVELIGSAPTVSIAYGGNQLANLFMKTGGPLDLAGRTVVADTFAVTQPATVTASDTLVAGNVFLSPGASFLPMALSVAGVLADSGAAYSVVSTEFRGTGQTIPRLPYTNLAVTGTAALPDSLAVGGRLWIHQPGARALVGGRAFVTGDLVVGDTAAGMSGGALVMTDASDTVRVTGQAYFGGEDGASFLTAGLLELYGDFAQVSNGAAGQSFRPTGTHATRFAGAAQNIRFNAPTASAFKQLRVSGAHTLFLTTAAVDSGLTVDSGGSVVSDSGQLHVSGPLVSFGAVSLYSLAAYGDVTVDTLAGTYVSVGGTLTANPATFSPMFTSLLGSGTVPVLPYNHLNILNPGVRTAAGNLTVTAALATNSGGELAIGNDTVTVGAAVHAYGPGITGTGQVIVTGPIPWAEGVVPNLRLMRGGIVGTTADSLRVNGSLVLDSGRLSFGSDGLPTVVRVTGNTTVSGLVMREQVDTLWTGGSFTFWSNTLADTLDAGVVVALGAITATDMGPPTTGSFTVVAAGSGSDSIGLGLETARLRHLVVTDSRTLPLSAPLIVDGNATIQGSATLVPGVTEFYVTDTLRVIENGAVAMLDTLGLVQVNGLASFAGRPSAGLLRAGELRLLGSFSQSGDPASFVADSVHRTSAYGPGTHTIAFSNGDSLASRLRNFMVTGGGTANLVGNVVVTGAADVQAFGSGVTSTVNGSGKLSVLGSGLTLYAEAFGTASVVPDTVVLRADVAMTGAYSKQFSPLFTHFIGANLPLHENSSAPYNYRNVRIEAGAVVDSMLYANIAGDLVVAGGVLDMHGGYINVDSNFATTGTGTLKMTGGEQLTVYGNATFGGGSTAGLLTSGLLLVSGNFTQTGDPTSFVASGTHTTEFGGTGTHTVTFASGSSTTSRAQNVRFTKAGEVLLSGTLTAMGDAMLQGADTVAGSGTLAVAGTLNLTTVSDYVPRRPILQPAEVALGGAVTTTGSPFGHFGPALTRFVGSGHLLRPDTSFDYGNVIVEGGLKAPSTMSFTIAGDLTVASGAFVVDSATVTVGGDLVTTGSGTLDMSEQFWPGQLTVNGNAEFRGGSTDGLLTAGTLILRSNFAQYDSVSPTSFTAGGTHVTRFEGAWQHAVSFTSPDSDLAGTGSRFNHVQLGSTNSAASLLLTTDASAAGQLRTAIGDSLTRTITGAHRLHAGGMDVQFLVFDSTLLKVTDLAGWGMADSVTFQNQETNATHFWLRAAASPSASFYRWNFLGGLTSSGRYITLENTGSQGWTLYTFSSSPPVMTLDVEWQAIGTPQPVLVWNSPA